MRTPLAVALTLALAACSSDAESPAAPDAGAADASVYPDDVAYGEASIRRLTRSQYANTIADVFGDVVIPDVSEPDIAIGGLLSVGASGATYTARGVESLENASFAIAEQALDDADTRARLVPCAAADGDAACVESMVGALGRRLWRRPLTDTERARIAAVGVDAGEALGDFDGGLVYAIAALLQSPNFLFRNEIGVAAEGGRALDAWQLASRLSFFLWNTSPDEALLDAAESGDLLSEAGLRGQAERLLASPRARDGMRNFFSEYLRLYELDELRKDPDTFEHFSTLLGGDAREETLRLMEHIVFDEASDYRNVMTTRTTFVSPRLATLYDIPAPVAGDFGQVKLSADGPRAGLLGHASFLALHAHAVSSSATRRGVAVRQLLLCHEIPAPPVDVDTSIPEPSGEAPTLRDRVAEHLENDSCAGCHSLMDPIGLTLEHFDGIGRWRDLDNGHPIDVTGWLDGVDFSGARGLGQTIREHEDFAPCLVRTLTRYATGRVETRPERAVLEVLSERFAASDYRVQPLLLEVVMSPMFRLSGEPR